MLSIIRMLENILIFILVFVLVYYIVVMFFAPDKSYQGGEAMYDLSKTNTVLDYKTLPWTNKACAIRFAIYIAAAPKTLSKVECVNKPADGGDIISFAPSCDNFEFKKCACNATDCSRCDIPKNYYLSKLLAIDNSLEFWASGYTSENDKPYVPALLKIKSSKSKDIHFMESISLPALSLQRWTVVTIVKEGRRFDIYYGTKLVKSKLLEYIPVPPSAKNWYAGNQKWKGSIGLFKGFEGSISSEQIEEDVSKLVDTRGVPLYFNNMNFMKTLKSAEFPSLTCPFGLCNQLPDVIPTSPFESLSA
jgi:hypothetical protein